MEIQAKNKINKYLDKFVLFFFVSLVFFIPISISGIEICFFGILIGMVFKAIICKPTVREVKAFFSDKVNMMVLIFYLCVGLSMIASGPLFMKSFRAWITKWGEAVLLFYFASIFLNKKRVKILLHVLLGTALLICVDGLWQKAFGVDFLRGFSMTDTAQFDAVRATFAHYNDFGTFLAVMIFINLGFFKSWKSWGPRAFSMLLFVLMGINLFFTYSRGAWLAVFLVLFFWAVFILSNKNKIFMLSGFSIMLAVGFLVPDIRESIVIPLLHKGTSGRIYMWGKVFDLVKDFPFFGCGVGLYMDVSIKYVNLGYQYAHNCYLQILAETGIFGLVSFMAFLGSIIHRSCSILKNKFDIVFLGIFSGFAAFLIHAFFDTQLFSIQLSSLFWVLCAVLVKFPFSASENTDRMVRP